MTYVIRLSNGILEHCAAIGVAIWVFLWMLDKTTRETPGEDGRMEGLVLGGRAIPARDIGNDLQMNTRTVHAHLKHLIEGGYLRPINLGDGIPSGYCVLKSKKWALRSADPYEKTADPPTKNLQTPAEKTVDPCSFSAPLNRNKADIADKTGTKNKVAPFVAPAWLPIDPWVAYLEMRKKRRHEPTEHAKDLVVRELDKLRASGQDPGRVLDQSTRNGWTDVYPLKNGAANGKQPAANASGSAARTKRNLDNLKQAIVASGDYATAGRDDGPDSGLLLGPGDEPGDVR